MGGVGVAITLTVAWLWYDAPLQIATVNIRKLTQDFINAQVKQDMGEPALNKRVAEFSQQLDKALQKVADEHHAVLVPSEAVIVGAKDVTLEVNNLTLTASH